MSTQVNTPQFSPIEMIIKGWELVIANPGPLIGGSAVVAIITIAASSIPLGGLIIQGPLLYGLYTVALAAVRGKRVDFQDVFSGFQRFVPTFVAGLLIGAFEAIGFVLCIVPGIVATLLYLPAYLYMLEEGLDFWPAMEKSRTVVMNNIGQWALLALALFGVNLLGAIACGIGLLISAPISLVVIALAFELEQQAARGTTFSTSPLDSTGPSAPGE